MQVSGSKPVDYSQDNYRKVMVNNREYNGFTASPDAPLSEFQKALNSWKEGETKASLSDEDISELRSKYNVGNMSDKDNIAFLGDLVERGVLTKQEASYIYLGVIPISTDISVGTLEKCDTDYNPRSMRAGDSPSTTDWLEHYQEFLSHVLSNTTANIGESNIINSYQAYVDILSRMSAEKSTVVM